MLTDYIEAAMRHAKYEILPDDNSYYGEIPECRGVYANEKTLAETEKDLRGALEGWILLGIRHGAELPIIEGIDLNVHAVA